MKSITVALIMGLFLVSCVAEQPANGEESSAAAPSVAALGSPAGQGPQATLQLPARLSSDGLAALLAAPDSAVVLLDVRTAEEYAAGRIPGAILAPYDQLASSFSEADKNRPIVVYCRSGNRSGIAMKTLRSMGYLNLSDFGGISNWKGGLEYQP